MKKASEYRRHAEECRGLAAQMQHSDQREQLLRMAEQWDQLAQDRIDLVRRHPVLALPGEIEAEDARDPGH